MKLILIPLSVMTVLILVSLAGYGTTEYAFGETELSLTGSNDDYYYDVNGVAKLNITTLEPLDSGEKLVIVAQHIQSFPDAARFYNDSGLIHTYYNLYYDSGGQYKVAMKDLGKTYSGATGSSAIVDMDSSLAFIAIVVAVAALAALVGVTILGSGESEYSVSVIKC